MNSGLKLIWSELLTIVNNASIRIDEIHMHNYQRQSNDDIDDTSESCETYLMRILTNPLSLKQLSRIVVRNRIIENTKNQSFVRQYVLSDSKYQLNSAIACNKQISSSVVNATATQNRKTPQTSSILECLIWQLDIPKTLHIYLYRFPDVPPMPEDVAIFVND